MPKAIRNPEIKFRKVGESFDIKSMVMFTAAKSLSASGDCDKFLYRAIVLTRDDKRPQKDKRRCKKISNIARIDYKVIFLFVFGTPVELGAGNRGMRNGESLKVIFLKHFSCFLH